MKLPRLVLVLGAGVLLIFPQLVKAQAPAPFPGTNYGFFLAVTDGKIIDDTEPDGTTDGVIGYLMQDPNTGYFTDPITLTITIGTGGIWTNAMFVYSGSTLVLNGGNGSPLSGGSVNGGADGAGGVILYDNSTLSMSGQSYVHRVTATYTANLNMTGGEIGISGNAQGTSVGGLNLFDSATATVTGTATIYGGIYVQGDYGTPAINVSGGTLSSIVAQYTGAAVSVSGGLVDGVTVEDKATLQMSGGTVNGLVADSGAQAEISGGTISGGISADEGTAILDDGSIQGSLSVVDPNGVIIVNGGSITGGASASNKGLVTIEGGTIGGSVSAAGGGTASVDNATVGGDVTETSSSLYINGGNIGGNATAQGGQLVFNGGNLTGSVTASSSALVTITGGSIQSNLAVADQSILTMSGGKVLGTATNTGEGNFSMTGGTIGALQVQDNTLSNLTGGTVTGNVSASASSNVYLAGASVQGKVTTSNLSNLTLSAGAVYGGIQASGSSTIYWTGGAIFGGIDNVSVSGDASFIWSGGKLTAGSGAVPNPQPLFASVRSANLSPADDSQTLPSIYLYDQAQFQMTGIDTSATLLDANNSNGMFSEYQLSGYYPDGTAIPSGIDIFVENSGSPFFSFTAANQQWTNLAGGSWSDANNWSPNMIADGQGALATFDSTNSAGPVTVSLDGDHTVGTLYLQGPNPFVIVPGSGGSLIFDNQNQGSDASINVAGSHEIVAPVVANDNTDINLKAEADGEVDLGPNQLTLHGGITVASGDQLTVYAARSIDSLTTAFVRGGTLYLQKGLVQMIPNGTAAGASHVEGLIINPNATLDLADNDLQINNSTLDAIVPLLQSGYAGGSWNGTGIISSTVSSSQRLAAVTGAQYLALYPGANFDGNRVCATDVLIKTALIGDTNLDGKVDFLDLLAVAENYDGTSTTWATGDFNYDGQTNSSDLFDLLGNYDLSSLTPTEVSELDSVGGPNFVSDFEQDDPDAPEPSSVALLTIGAVAGLHRRPRRDSGRRECLVN